VAGVVGLVLSMVFLPDVNGMELSELDNLWTAIKVSPRQQGHAPR
jgi:hypothetical protein